jgi:hydrogenase maturation protein HypF
VAEDVAPRLRHLGLMLPYTPLQHLLLERVDRPLVMTSGNRSDEPIAYQDDDALARLGGIADLFLAHDRPIEVRCDDSVARVIEGAPSVLRRARGYVPLAISLTHDAA